MEAYSGHVAIASTTSRTELAQALGNVGLSFRDLRFVSKHDPNSLSEDEGISVVILELNGPSSYPETNVYQMAPYAGPHNNAGASVEDPRDAWPELIKRAFKRVTNTEVSDIEALPPDPAKEFYRFKITLPATLDVVGNT